MACGNLIKWIVPVLLAALLWAPAVHADALRSLKDEVTTLQRALSQAETAERNASQALARNHDAQRRATGDQLARLKTEATRLAAEEATAAEATQQARRNLAAKQGELRDTASRLATAQLTEQGDLATRMARALAAAREWQGAIGDLPSVPAVRDLSGIVDPAEQAAIKAGDRNRLRAYETWANAEIQRVDAELRRAQLIINAENDIRGDGDGARLVAQAKDIKSTLETRKQALNNDLRTARNRLRDLR